jgi:hypothetical protein
VSPFLRASEEQERDVAHPALIRALERGGSADFLAHALHALAKLRDVPALEDGRDFASLVPRFLASGNEQIVSNAILAMGVRGQESFVDQLENVLLLERLGDAPDAGSASANERAFAALALGLIGERTQWLGLRGRIHKALIQALAVRREEVQAAAILAIGLNLLPADRFELDSHVLDGDEGAADAPIRAEQIADVLSYFEDESRPEAALAQAPTTLARLCQGAPRELRAHVAQVLLPNVSPTASVSREVQCGVVLALGRLGSSGADPIDRSIRSELERIGYRSSADQLTRYLAMVSLGQVAGRASEGEAGLEGLAPARKLFIKHLTRSRGQTLCWTALALGLLEESAGAAGEIPSADSAAALRDSFARAHSTETSGAIALALGMMRSAEAEALFLDRLRSSGDARERGYIALALGMIGAREALPVLRQTLTEAISQPFTLEQSAIALSLIGDQDVTEALFAVLEASSNPDLQVAIASALGWIQDPRPIGRLCERLERANLPDQARAWSAVALGRICDDDDWPWVARVVVGFNYDTPVTALVDPIFGGGALDLP